MCALPALHSSLGCADPVPRQLLSPLHTSYSARVSYLEYHCLFVVDLCLLNRLSMASFQAVVYEYAVEMTYPLPEGTSAGLINVTSQVIDKL